jgi:hypothetical protein
MFNDFMTPEILTTYAGLTGALIIIVQFTKSMVKRQFGDSSVRLYSFIIALILTSIFASHGFSFQGIMLTVINAAMITIGSMGGYEMLADPLAQSTKVR